MCCYNNQKQQKSRFRAQPSWSQRGTSRMGQVLRFQLEDPWNGGWHSPRGPRRWSWQCCPPAPQPESETAAPQGAHWPDSCTPHPPTSPSAPCTRSAVPTTGLKTGRGHRPRHPIPNSRAWRRKGACWISSFLLPLTLTIIDEQKFLNLSFQDWTLQANGKQNYWQDTRDLWQA